MDGAHRAHYTDGRRCRQAFLCYGPGNDFPG